MYINNIVFISRVFKLLNDLIRYKIREQNYSKTTHWSVTRKLNTIRKKDDYR